MSEKQKQDPKEHSFLRRVLFFLKFLEIRLRFVFILAVTAIVVGYWDHVQNYYERWQREHGRAAAGAAANGEAAHSDIEYFCPMHTFVVRDHAGKCPICGMDLVKRQKGAAQPLPEGVIARVQASPERVTQAGVRVEQALCHLLSRQVSSYGVIEPAEQNVSRIIARFPGRVDELLVNTAGATVRKGEPLAKIYSPKFLAAGEEYLQALGNEREAAKRGAPAGERARAAQLTEFARQRLALAGFTEEQIASLGDGGAGEGSAASAMRQTVTLFAPIAGVVLEKNILQGEMVEEGTALYTIADLGAVWAQALVPERDLGQIKPGLMAEIKTPARPGEIFRGTVDFVYPEVDAASRAGKARVVIENKRGELKPGMSIEATFFIPVGRYGAPGTFSKQAAQSATGGATAQSVEQTSAETVKKIKLPTETEADAQAYLATLPAGAKYYECPMHSEVVSGKATDDCPKCGMHLEEKTKAAEAANPEMKMAQATPAAQPQGATEGSLERWAEGWACPMHLDQLASTGGICRVDDCGMPMRRWEVERVLAVPEAAVIDTGSRKVIYVENAPGVFDAREVTLGPRAGQFYPVLSGLKSGEKIASRGSFLIDAESRLNPVNSVN